MTFFRRRLRLLAAVWFLFQGASLSAIVPRDCCATHRRASHHQAPAQQGPPQQESVQQESAQQPSCHKPVTVTPDEAQCPMRGADGAPCAMHKKGHGAHAHHAETSATDTDADAPPCTMRAICTEPMDALVVLLVQPGVLPSHAAFPIDLHVDDAPPVSSTRLIHGLFSPDLPPPRA